MPNSNQGHGQGQGHPQGQGQGGTAQAKPPTTSDVKDKAQQVVGQAKEAAQPVLDQARAAAEQYAQQAKEHYGNVREGAVQGYRQAEGAIARNPVPALLISFGVGFGLGIVLTSLLGAKEETWQDKYLPDSVKGLADRFKDVPDRLKEVPDQYSSLVDSLKGLPKSVLAQLPKGLTKYLG